MDGRGEGTDEDADRERCGEAEDMKTRSREDEEWKSENMIKKRRRDRQRHSDEVGTETVKRLTEREAEK